MRALGSPAWATDPALATYAERRARHDELDDRLAEWCAEHDPEEAAELLVAHGVPAGVGRDPRSMFDHPQLNARGFYEEIDHPEVGRQRTPTLPFRFASLDHWLRTRARRCSASTTTRSSSTTSASARRSTPRSKPTGIIGNRPKGL